uniref:Uncharacterized protein n=1 Tax=viral metagenome TaxID=1070528 RepID=A0A6C0HID6_9ZZZZ
MRYFMSFNDFINIFLCFVEFDHEPFLKFQICIRISVKLMFY